MAWITPTIAGVGALANLGSSLLGTRSNNDQQVISAILQEQQLKQAQSNEAYQRTVQDLVNKRAVAGTSDSFGTTVSYDPTTNTWEQNLGALPKSADTAALQASITRNTTDLMQQELANRVSMQRAAQAGGAYDTAQRNLQNFQPMSAETLRGLLTQQGIEAARQSYDPLRADTLRSVARTGTAAGPVLRQLGLGEAQNLRNTLNDAAISALTNASSINTSNYQRLANAATTNAALATPSLGQGNLGNSSTDQLIQQLTGTRAQWAPSSTAQGAYGSNQAISAGNQAANAAAGAVPNTNFNLQQTQSALRSLGSYINQPGQSGLGGLISSIFGSGGGDKNNPANQWDMSATNPTMTYDTGDKSGWDMTT